MCHTRSSRRDSACCVSNYFFLPLLFVADFLCALAFLACVAPCAAACLCSALCSASCSACTAFTFFGFGSASSAALKLWPSKAISVIFTAVNGCRCPASFLYCFLRL